MKVASRWITALLIPLLLTIPGGCGFFDSDSSKSSSYNRGKLCSEFSEFFKSELSLNVQEYDMGDFDKPIGWTSACFPSRAGGLAAGELSMIAASSEGDQMASASFELQKGFAEEAWLAPGNKFRVQAGEWVGRMEISNMELTDEQTRKAIEFLVRVTQDVRDAA
ncbi:hypothetical protein HLB23_39500 [Nocardia uniformis]|uniref:Uncharacterized protein n=1 Tax=Nocardia uniformis TaxID=53432 RepID=A0A849CB72_9NOCA|nr:hypothetical protein [Nocardia uniformis]NNH75874.1 hypothetical protein [Nocardia uniformis]